LRSHQAIGGRLSERPRASEPPKLSFFASQRGQFRMSFDNVSRRSQAQMPKPCESSLKNRRRTRVGTMASSGTGLDGWCPWRCPTISSTLRRGICRASGQSFARDVRVAVSSAAVGSFNGPTTPVVPMAQGDLAVPVGGALRWCLMAIGHHEVDHLHGLAVV